MLHGLLNVSYQRCEIRAAVLSCRVSSLPCKEVSTKTLCARDTMRRPLYLLTQTTMPHMMHTSDISRQYGFTVILAYSSNTVRTPIKPA